MNQVSVTVMIFFHSFDGFKISSVLQDLYIKVILNIVQQLIHIYMIKKLRC